MDRLDFTLPDFTRIAWVSDRARQVWEPRIHQITAAWLEVEWRAVVAGVRRCALTTVSPDAFPSQALDWTELGLAPLPIAMVGSTGQQYSATEVPYRAGAEFLYRVVVGAPADVSAFSRAWKDADQETIGELLGYPACCREFFRRVWVDEQMVDTTWPMAAGIGAEPVGDDPHRHEVEVSGPPLANILWRWMGVRAVPHLPCRPDCEATAISGAQLVAVGRAAGFDQEMDWLVDILSWSVEWSALHGIAEIRTPVLKVATRTDATPHRYVVRRIGSPGPAEGAQGLRFPFTQPVRLHLSPTRGFRRGLDHAAPVAGSSSVVVASEPDWLAADNGFADIASMRAAHRPIVELAGRLLQEVPGDVVDFGCGNGLLARDIAALVGSAAHGVDVDADRIRRAREAGGDPDCYVNADLADFDPTWWGGKRFALGVIMPGRLLETSRERADGFLAELFRRCDRVLAYAYGDWLERAGGLPALLADIGLDVDRGAGEQPRAVALVIPAPSSTSSLQPPSTANRRALVR